MDKKKLCIFILYILFFSTGFIMRSQAFLLNNYNGFSNGANKRTKIPLGRVLQMQGYPNCGSTCLSLGYNAATCGTCPSDGSCYPSDKCRYNPASQGTGPWDDCGSQNCCCYNSATCTPDCESRCSPSGCAGICNFNGVCDPGETQENCGETVGATDCRTTIIISPDPAAPGTTVTVTIEFWDSRYDPTHTVYIDLTIGGIGWMECFHNVPITDTMSCYSPYKCQLTKESRHFKITGICTVPYIPGTQVIRAAPRFQSLLVVLHAATREFTIVPSGATVTPTPTIELNKMLEDFLKNFINTFSNFFLVA